jgi:hypothetical protein
MLALLLATNLLYLTDDRASVYDGDQFTAHLLTKAPSVTITTHYLESAGKTSAERLTTQGIINGLMAKYDPSVVVNNTMNKIDDPRVLNVNPANSPTIESFAPRLIAKLEEMRVEYTDIVILSTRSEKSIAISRLYASQFSRSVTIVSVTSVDDLKNRLPEVMLNKKPIIVNLMHDYNGVAKAQYDHILFEFNTSFLDIGFTRRAKSEAILFEINRHDFLTALDNKEKEIRFRVKMNSARLRELNMMPEFSSYEGVF